MTKQFSYNDYSLEDLLEMKSSIDAAIGRKKQQEYDAAIGKVLDALREMSEKYPREDAVEIECDYFLTWEGLFKLIREYH